MMLKTENGNKEKKSSSDISTLLEHASFKTYLHLKEVQQPVQL